MGTPLAMLSPWAQQQVSQKLRAQLITPAQTIAPTPSRKYRNIPTVYQSSQGFVRRYDSMAEANYAATLDLGIKTGLVRFWLPQVPFPLIGGVKYVADFMVSWQDGHVSFVDVKGRDTQASINKRKQVKATFGVDIEIARKA